MTTVALNIIVGPKEARLLERCLTTFDAKNVFDEIVIVNTSLDEKVNEVARKYTDKVFYYQWETERYPHGNFGGARNFAAENTTSDKIWWLDTDDICKDEFKEKLYESIKLIKDDQYKDIMIWLMPYTIIMSDDGNPDVWFKRERVYDRQLIKWKGSIHEILFPGIEQVKYATINNMHITHLPNKPTYVSAIRNVAMLENEFKFNPDSTQVRYFLGRDYMFTGRVEEGIALLESILSDMTAGYEMLYAISMELAWFYTYGCLNPRPEIEFFKKENSTKAEGYCRMAITFAQEYAEPYILLGDVYVYTDRIDSSIIMYKQAMNKPLGKGKFQTRPLYLEIPADRLSRVYDIKNFNGMAVHFNEVAKRANPVREYYLDRKRILINKLLEEYNNECKDEPSKCT